MYQNNRGSYRTNETLFGMFYHSCLGKIIILLAVLGALSVIAHFTRPSEKRMRAEMNDNIRQCIESPDSLHTDWMDDAVANIGYMFTTADSTVDTELMRNFNKYNRLEYYRHWTFSSMYVFNNFNLEGARCGIGIFGLVIPTINFNDLILREGPVRKDYDKPLIEVNSDEYLGSNPDPVFHGEYDNQ